MARNVVYVDGKRGMSIQEVSHWRWIIWTGMQKTTKRIILESCVLTATLSPKIFEIKISGKDALGEKKNI